MKLTAEQIKNAIQEHESKIIELQEELKKTGYVTGFERVKEDEKYFSIDDVGEVKKMPENLCGYDERVFNIANYGSEKRMSLLEKMNRLQRLLYRFSCENGGDRIDWSDKTKQKYSVSYNHHEKVLGIYICPYLERPYLEHINQIYFASEKAAEQALEQFRPLMLEIIEEQEEVKKYYLDLNSKEKLTSSYKFELGREFLIEDTIYEIIDIGENETGTIYEIEGKYDETDYDFETYTESELEQIILRGSFNE